jgi:four helix bundle protein
LRDWEIIRRFEELPCWQKARKLCQSVSMLTSKAKFQKNSNLSGQVWKAAGSAMDNIAEGFDGM